MGHVASLRRYGIPASAPMFIPGLGAFVRLKQYPADAREDARVGLAGPIWGLTAAAVFLAVGKFADQPSCLAIAAIGLAYTLNGDGLLILILVLAAVRAMAKDAPAVGDRTAFVQYAGLVLCLALVAQRH